MQPSSRLLSRTLTLLLAVGGCATDPAADPPPAGDTTGPAVVSVSPGDRATDVATSTAIVATFSEPIDPETVDASWIHLTIGNYEVPVSLAIAHADQLQIVPLGGLGNGTAYRLTVTSVADLAGNVMTPFASQFSTIAGRAEATDPTGDTFGTGTFLPDLTLATASTQDAVTITLQFAQPIAPSLAGAPSSVAGYIDIDIDQNAATGQFASTDRFRADGGSTGLGDEYMVALFQNPDGTLPVIDLANGTSGGYVMPTFTATSVSFTIPLAMLGNDEGNLNLAAVVGSMQEPTDIIPNSQHLTLGAGGGGGCTPAVPRPAPAVAPVWQRY
ncbi:MAG TPA: Ig-like domain-containing protein [Kofleriaceae bacterium]|nr:Ig-like domain-containing protein [Kofleriaceae bacterium]